MYRYSNTFLLQKLLVHSNKTFTLLNNFSAIAARADSSYTYGDVQQTPDTQFLDKDPNFTNGYPPNPNGVYRKPHVLYKDPNFSTNNTVGIHGSGNFLHKDANFTNGYPPNSNGVQGATQVLYKDQNFSNGYSPNLSGSSQANGNLDNNAAEGKAEQVISFIGTIDEFDYYFEGRRMVEAIEVLKLLENKCIILDVERYLMLIQACKEVGELNGATFVHNHIMRLLGHIRLSEHNSILDMYFRCGYVSEARELYEKLPERNLTSWDIMISGLARNRYGEDAIDVFTQFIKLGHRPDGQMFMGVFLACSVVSDVNNGMIYFESMSREYGIVPSMEHYVSVVNMLGSTGYLDEAKEFIENMPVEANVEIWETLMNNCIVYGNTDLGNHCIEIVNFLDPTRLTKESKLGLLPVKSSSLVTAEVKQKSNNLQDIATKTQQYRAGDIALPENQMNSAILRQLSVHMKEAGYVPALRAALHDVDEESKAEHLLSHSEKLAAVQGFMTSAVRAPVRIMKNLRICIDCHNAMMLMSKIAGRELVVRDTKRFHHFKDGKCSCNNFW